jgi:hypothetical protein
VQAAQFHGPERSPQSVEPRPSKLWDGDNRLDMAGMTSPATILRRARLVLAAIAVLALLVLPATASAKRHHASKDRNHDGVPDKWAKRHHLGKGKGMAKADPDKDGLKNRGEWRSRTDPNDADSDGDGLGDADEDRDGDSVDNGNELREHTNPCRGDSDGDGKRDGKEDADRDDLNNAGEDDAGTDPIDPDSDGDGVKDGEERAGAIVSFDGTTLTLRLFGGSTLSGTVDENTFIDCGDDSWQDDDSGDETDAEDDGWVDTDPDEKVAAREDVDTGDEVDDPDAGDDDSFDDDGTVDEGDDLGDDDLGDDSDDSGDDSDDEDSADDGAGGCATDTLKPGAVVNEADVSYTGKGAFFDAIELAR